MFDRVSRTCTCTSTCKHRSNIISFYKTPTLETNTHVQTIFKKLKNELSGTCYLAIKPLHNITQ